MTSGLRPENFALTDDELNYECYCFNALIIVQEYILFHKG